MCATDAVDAADAAYAAENVVKSVPKAILVLSCLTIWGLEGIMLKNGGQSMSHIRTNPCMIEKQLPAFFSFVFAPVPTGPVLFYSGGHIDECF